MHFNRKTHAIWLIEADVALEVIAGKAERRRSSALDGKTRKYLLHALWRVHAAENCARASEGAANRAGSISLSLTFLQIHPLPFFLNSTNRPFYRASIQHPYAFQVSKNAKDFARGFSFNFFTKHSPRGDGARGRLLGLHGVHRGAVVRFRRGAGEGSGSGRGRGDIGTAAELAVKLEMARFAELADAGFPDLSRIFDRYVDVLGELGIGYEYLPPGEERRIGAFVKVVPIRPGAEGGEGERDAGRPPHPEGAGAGAAAHLLLPPLGLLGRPQRVLTREALRPSCRRRRGGSRETIFPLSPHPPR